MVAAAGGMTMDKDYKRKKKTEMFSSPKAKRAEIEEKLAIAEAHRCRLRLYLVHT